MRVTDSGFVPVSLMILATLSSSELTSAFSTPVLTRSRPLSIRLQRRGVRSESIISAPTSQYLSVVVSEDSDTVEVSNAPSTVRDRLRQMTGFSLTALRTTMRTMTGVSLTAIFLGAVAFTSLAVRNSMAFVLRIFPTWFRYFLQPFLVLYYVPLIAIRGMAGPNRQEKLATHQAFVDHIKEAVIAADEAQNGGYWPVHVNDDGVIEAVLPPDPNQESIDMTEALVESVEVAQEQEERKRT